MQKVLKETEENIKKITFPQFKIGDLVRVHRRVKEGSKERIQIVEGEIIAHKHGFEPGGSITLRRVTLGIAVELVIPLFSPLTEKMEIVKRQKVRRAKLYFLRRSKDRRIKLKEDLVATSAVREENVRLKAEEKQKIDNEKKALEEEKAQAEKEGTKSE